MDKEKCREFLFRIDNIANRIEKIIKVAVCILLIVLTVAVVSGIVTRNINFPIVWLGELGTFSFVWLTFLSMALAYKHKLFPNVDIINRFVTDKGVQRLSMLTEIVSLVVIGIVLWSSRDFMAYLVNSGHVSAELRIPMIYVYIGPMLGYILTLFFGIINMCKKIIAFKHPDFIVEKEVGA